MESYQKAAAITALGLAALSGCGGNVETTDFNEPGTDAGADSADGGSLPDATGDGDADVNENLKLTRAEFAKSLVGEVLKIEHAPEGCSSSFKDVPHDSDLCTAVELLNKRGAMTGYKDANGQLTGFWGPDDPMTRAQTWKAVTKAIGLADHPADCQKNYPDFSAEGWYGNFLGSLCDHGLVTAGPDGLVHPNDDETTQGWDASKILLDTYLSEPGIRSDIVEATDAVILGHNTFGNLDCTPIFPDVPGNTYLCVAIKNLVDAMAIDGYQDGNFRLNDTFNLAELSKMYVNAGNLGGNAENCFEGSPDTWYYLYAQVLCQNGIIAPDADMASNPSVRFTYEAAWKVAEAK